MKILGLDKKEMGNTELPVQFSEEIRPDLIKRAVLTLQANKRQPYGAKEGAGQRHSAYLSKRRKSYRGTYGIGQSRTPRKVMSRKGRRLRYVGAVAPQTVGGRRAHPPKAEKIYAKRINDKERRKAIRSAISATVISNLVEQKHLLPDEYPLIIDKKLENIATTKDVKTTLLNLGLVKELERCKVKKIRAGKGKSRGRKYKTKTGPLIVVSNECKLLKSAQNIPGVDVVIVNNLNAETLAPGAVPGRLTLWTQKSIEKLSKDKLFE